MSTLNFSLFCIFFSDLSKKISVNFELVSIQIQNFEVRGKMSASLLLRTKEGKTNRQEWTNRRPFDATAACLAEVKQDFKQ